MLAFRKELALMHNPAFGNRDARMVETDREVFAAILRVFFQAAPNSTLLWPMTAWR
jgi:phosphoenolpyruvate-protein kinase (PTS system EI component)